MRRARRPQPSLLVEREIVRRRRRPVENPHPLAAPVPRIAQHDPGEIADAVRIQTEIVAGRLVVSARVDRAVRADGQSVDLIVTVVAERRHPRCLPVGQQLQEKPVVVARRPHRPFAEIDVRFRHVHLAAELSRDQHFPRGQRRDRARQFLPLAADRAHEKRVAVRTRELHHEEVVQPLARDSVQQSGEVPGRPHVAASIDRQRAAVRLAALAQR